VRTLKEIRGILQEHMDELKLKYEVRTTEIFGSYAQGEQEKDGDLDLLAEFEKQVAVIPRDSLRRELWESVRREAVRI